MSRPDAPQPSKRRTIAEPAPVADPVVLPPSGDGGPVSDDPDSTDAPPEGYEAV